MKLEYFITKRLIRNKDYKSSVSAPIIKIAIAAIALGIVMMLISVSTGLGLKYKIRDKISAFSGHIVITNFDNNNSDATIVPIERNLEGLMREQNIAGIQNISAYANIAGIIRTPDAFEGIVYKGVDSLYNFHGISEYLIQGRLPVYTLNQMSNEIVLSSYMANRLNFTLGDKVTTYFQKSWGNQVPNVRQFEIVGIFNSGLQQFDENIVIGDLAHVQRLNRWSQEQVGGFEINIEDFDHMEQVSKALYLELPPTIDSKTIAEKYSNIFGWLDMFDFNILIIIVIMIIVASVNMVVALLVMILERTQMIGVLKALGANNWTIRKIFLLNACYLVLKGLLVGNVIGIGLLLCQKYFGIIKLDPVSYYVNQAPVLLRASDVIFLNVGVVGISLFFLLIPSYLITKISPIKAIKYN